MQQQLNNYNIGNPSRPAQQKYLKVSRNFFALRSKSVGQLCESNEATVYIARQGDAYGAYYKTWIFQNR